MTIGKNLNESIWDKKFTSKAVMPKRSSSQLTDWTESAMIEFDIKFNGKPLRGFQGKSPIDR
jgi:hypothetical protein